MTIDIDTLGKELTMYRGRMDEHLKAAAAYDNAAKDSRARAAACAGAIEAVQRMMDMVKAPDAPAPEGSTAGESDADADVKGPEDVNVQPAG